MILDIQVDATSAIAFLEDLKKRQIPFATAVALNRTADDAQAAVRRHIGQAFTLRRKDFVERTIKIENRDRATKTRPFVILGVDPSRDFLAKFELGGQKTPISGKALAVPINARRNKRDIVTKGQRVRSLNLHRVGKRVLGDRRTFVAGGAVLQRFGRRGQVRVLHAFKPSVPIKPDLHFYELVVSTVESRWAANFDGALEFALRSAR